MRPDLELIGEAAVACLAYRVAQAALSGARGIAREKAESDMRAALGDLQAAMADAPQGGTTADIIERLATMMSPNLWAQVSRRRGA